MVPSRSLVTKASGPDGLELQAVKRRILTQRRNGATTEIKSLRFRTHFSVAPLRRCVSILLLISDTAPHALATTHRRRKAHADAPDRSNRSDPNVFDNLPCASQTLAT